jgi:hypothetical protein
LFCRILLALEVCPQGDLPARTEWGATPLQGIAGKPADGRNLPKQRSKNGQVFPCQPVGTGRARDPPEHSPEQAAGQVTLGQQQPVVAGALTNRPPE